MPRQITRHLLEIEEALADETRLYRIVDFFAAAAILETNQLRFTRADSFEDKNEGVDRLLSQLEISRPSGCGRMGWTDQASAVREHDRVKHSHFVSCWTLVPESVAMWSLYSPDRTGVRLSTTGGKLKSALRALLNTQNLESLSAADVGAVKQVFVSGKLAVVSYAQLSVLATRLHRRNRAFDRIHARYRRQGRELPSVMDVDPRYWQREDQRQLRELTSAFALKDASFAHEHEVRAVARMGEVQVTERFLETLDIPDSEPMKERVLRRYLSSAPYPKETMTASHISVRVPDPLIETVAVDPRCPPHKAAFMKEWFHARGVPVVDSSCFGYLPASLEVFPPE